MEAIMKTLGVIPARYGSTRLLGKPLIEIMGHPMIWWVYNRVKTSKKLSEIVVATDDSRIEIFCKDNGIPCVMTSSAHRTAAERLQEVSEKLLADFYVQLNGDEPLIDVAAVDASIPDIVEQDAEFGTNVITEMQNPAQIMDPTNIKVVFDNNMKALFMSRTPIPFPYKSTDFSYFKHVGIIGYNKKMLDFYKESQPGKLELIEGIDTLRFVDYGKTLQFILVHNCQCLSVDTAQDIEIVKELMNNSYGK